VLIFYVLLYFAYKQFIKPDLEKKEQLLADKESE